MIQADFEQVQALFAGALERPAEQWEAYLAAAARAPHLSGKVLSLLAAHQGKGRFDRIAEQLLGVHAAAGSILFATHLESLRRVLGDRYQIERELGRGGMATVYLATDRRHHRSVAIKVLSPELAHTLAVERFLREIAIAALLDHPNILALYDSGEADGVPYYVMPFVEGQSLRERIDREKQLALDVALAIAKDVAAALGHAHARGVIHRDIKPENILLADGRARVADFGIARAISVAGGEQLTQTGIAIGTPAYMSPEQFSGSDDVDARSDLYSLGCVLYQMLTGETPYTGATPQAILSKKLSEPLPRLSVVRDTVPEPIEEAVERALAKVPVDRFATAEEFAQSLALDGAPHRRRRQQRSGPRLKPLAPGLAAVLVVAAGLFAWVSYARTPVYVAGRVVVAPVENLTGDTAIDGFARQLALTLPDAIAQEGVGDPVPAAAVRDLLPQAPNPRTGAAEWLARETGAGLALRGLCSGAGRGTTCQVDVLRQPASLLRMSVSVTGDPSDPAFAEELRERLLVALFLQQNWGDRVTWLGEYLPRSLAAVRAFKQACCDGPQSPEHYAEAARLDPGWVEAAAWAVGWTGGDSSEAVAESVFTQLARRPGLHESEREILEALTIDFRVTFSGKVDPGLEDVDRLYELYRRRFEVNPEWWLAAPTYYAEVTGRSAAAVAISSYADSALAPRSLVPPYIMRGDALHHLARYEEELQLAHQLQRRWPDRVAPRTLEIQALAGLGEVDSLRHRLAAWEATPETSQPGRGLILAGSRLYIAGLELMAHDNGQDGLAFLNEVLPRYRRFHEDAETRDQFVSYYVEILEETGRIDEAWTVAVRALKESGSADDSLSLLAQLGAIAALRGRPDEARRYDRLLDAVAQRPSLAGYGLWMRSIIAGRLGDREGAVRLLERARPYGVPMYRHSHREVAYRSLRDYPPFRRLLEPRD